MSQNLTIEIKTQGRNTVPIINSGNIITLHGKNGVGKSMAGTLLEIASGNYTFESEGRFNKLANVIQSCEIQFNANNSLLFKVELKPHLWRFDKKLNKINPLTLGDYFIGEKRKVKEIDFNEYHKNIFVRTIRGNESLQQQVFFFKDVLIAKINQKLEKLEKKLDFLNNYQNWLDKDELEALINNYSKSQENYNNDLNKISNFNNSISNRKASLNHLNKQLELTKKLIFLSNNDLEALKNKSQVELEKLTKTKEERESKTKELLTVEQNLKEMEEQFNEETSQLMKKLTTLNKKKEKLQKNLNLGNRDLLEIKKNIDHYQEQIKTYKISIEKLNKENSRILEINKTISLLRDICNIASTKSFSEEKIIKIKEGIYFSFTDLLEIFQQNNLVFKQDSELKEYQNHVKLYNEKIREDRKKLTQLAEYNKIIENIKKLKNGASGKNSKLDRYIDLDAKISNLKKKYKELQNFIEKLDGEIFRYKQNYDELLNIIEEVKKNPSKASIINELKQAGLRLKHEELNQNTYDKIIPKISKEIQQSEKKLVQMEGEKSNLEKTLTKSKVEWDHIAQKMRDASKKQKYLQPGKFLDYIKPHFESFDKYLNNTKELHKRLKSLKDDVENVIQGRKAKNRRHSRVINDQFDHIFRDLYGREEFFKYVFKDYSKIKNFDIGKKSIVFETLEGLEETRDLEEFSSGEKTYAYCRSIISMTSNLAKYNIIVLDESYALLDQEHSLDLYQFQEEMVKLQKISKFINILPLKENLKELLEKTEINLKEEEKRNNTETITSLRKQQKILQKFENEVAKNGYYQEIHYPPEERVELKVELRPISIYGTSNLNDELLVQDLPFSFILDGSNIARDNPNSKDNASVSDVIRCRNKLKALGVPEENILIVFGSALHHYITPREKDLYEELIKERNVNQAPAGRDDDTFIIQYALEHNSYIITNDRYLEYRENAPIKDKFLEAHSIRYSVIGNDILFEDGFKEKLKLIMSN